LRESITALVEAIIGRRLDYHALYPCTVMRQAADGTLDLVPDDARVRGSGCQGIRIRHGLPGFECTVPVSTRVLLGFEAGDPKRPYAMAWDVGSVTTVTFDSGTEDVARTGDSAGEFYVDTAQLALGLPHLWYRSPRGTGIWALVLGGVVPPVLATPGTAVVIDEGNSKLLA
jgi:hypothetical protein